MAGATALALALTGCDDTAPGPATRPVASAAAAPAASQTMAPQATAAQPARASGGIVLDPQGGGTTAGETAAGGATPMNDPSAPADSPLCGTAAREANAIGQSLLSRQYATAGECGGFACYDPSTATYLGADGYRHVCR